MDKKLISYIGLAIGVVLIFLGGGLLYLKEKSVKKIVVKNPKKIEVVISSQPTASVKPQMPAPLVSKSSAAAGKLQSSKTQKRKIAFKYRSSKPKTVFLVGDFNKWNKKANPMKKGQNFVWETVLMLPVGEYKYAYIVDGKRINDPNNRKTVHLKTGKASVLKVEPLP
ncbi:MAG: isoamylase early set domain-containing protein [Elusimicrobia bacterium]|nr:isoamylase early set domain-containing protein [Elusimicrobiota bacterium]